MPTVLSTATIQKQRFLAHLAELTACGELCWTGEGVGKNWAPWLSFTLHLSQIEKGKLDLSIHHGQRDEHLLGDVLADGLEALRVEIGKQHGRNRAKAAAAEAAAKASQVAAHA